MIGQETELCRHCGEPVVRLDAGRWSHGFGEWGSVGCRSYSFTLRGDWDERLTRAEKAAPRTRGQRQGREEFPEWPGLRERRLQAEREQRDAEALAATRFSPKLARAVEAAEAVVADPGSSTFRTLERRRQSVILAMEEQARRAAAEQGHCPTGSFTAQGELNRLMRLTRDLLRSLRTAEEQLPAPEALKAAASRYCARFDQIASDRYASLPQQGDGVATERYALEQARQNAAIERRRTSSDSEAQE
ncbi:hypothetical protein ACFXAW_35735 [Streptomyces sp. NPDC059445]|uniref:hypothetical protein n=1 Tax=unclassified Streptomyces TaxID=2593676 RepID=UPI003690BA8F